VSDADEMHLDLDRGLLSDRIYELVKAMIKDSTLKPGEQVVESQLARRLSVSQAPVREALKRLTHDGLITHVRHHGSFVTEFSKREAEHARIARVALEGLAARMAQGRVDESTRGLLLSIIDQMHAAADRGDIAGFRELDFEFHKTVVVACGNPYLPRMWDILEPSLRSMHVLSDPAFEGDWHVVAEMHRDLLTVLEGEDPDAANDLFSAHAIGMGGAPERPMGPAVNRFIAELVAAEPVTVAVDAAR
jgi:DNA-binding GntR family transcriptional regulator